MINKFVYQKLIFKSKTNLLAHGLAHVSEVYISYFFLLTSILNILYILLG